MWPMAWQIGWSYLRGFLLFLNLVLSPPPPSPQPERYVLHRGQWKWSYLELRISSIAGSWRVYTVHWYVCIYTNVHIEHTSYTYTYGCVAIPASVLIFKIILELCFYQPFATLIYIFILNISPDRSKNGLQIHSFYSYTEKVRPSTQACNIWGNTQKRSSLPIPAGLISEDKISPRFDRRSHSVRITLARC